MRWLTDSTERSAPGRAHKTGMSRTAGDTRVAAASLSARRIASRGRLHIERALLLALGFGVFTFAGGHGQRPLRRLA
jgi:hypothetical protein